MKILVTPPKSNEVPRILNPINPSNTDVLSPNSEITDSNSTNQDLLIGVLAAVVFSILLTLIAVCCYCKFKIKRGNNEYKSGCGVDVLEARHGSIAAWGSKDNPFHTVHGNPHYHSPSIWGGWERCDQEEKNEGGKSMYFRARGGILWNL